MVKRDLDLMGFDLLRLSAAQLQTLLENGRVTSSELVNLYLKQIDKHNHKNARLHAVISTAPRAQVFRSARELDARRKEGGPIGPMHGIPVIIKACSTDSIVREIHH